MTRKCLDSFCDLSDEQVSFSKSRVFCSNNINDAKDKKLADLRGSLITKKLSNYIGVPLIHGRITKSTYNYILEKSQKRLVSWKNRITGGGGARWRCWTVVKPKRGHTGTSVSRQRHVRERGNEREREVRERERERDERDVQGERKRGSVREKEGRQRFAGLRTDTSNDLPAHQR
ncbi:hypothetical protein Ddye_000274 [Dipteronia dyeriana]|uniref:Uncharacterized protein n=1 Tax=Dipteronia dyeriana TaxID=168575 RepID=A0AAD9XM09_9ROSI|nr:hypothetical protein Ddye_000274 [Dipteronia dyeriana]